MTAPATNHAKEAWVAAMRGDKRDNLAGHLAGAKQMPPEHRFSLHCHGESTAQLMFAGEILSIGLTEHMKDKAARLNAVLRDPEPAPLPENLPPLGFSYTNHRGMTRRRRAFPIHVYFGSTEWHTVPQWLMEAVDLDKGAIRIFAMDDMRTSPEPEPLPETAEDIIAGLGIPGCSLREALSNYYGHAPAWGIYIYIADLCRRVARAATAETNAEISRLREMINDPADDEPTPPDTTDALRARTAQRTGVRSGALSKRIADEATAQKEKSNG